MAWPSFYADTIVCVRTFRFYACKNLIKSHGEMTKYGEYDYSKKSIEFVACQMNQTDKKE